MESKLQRSEVFVRPTDSLDYSVVIEPRANRKKISFAATSWGSYAWHDLTPEEAYTLGCAFIEHAKECGYPGEPDAGD